MPRGKSWKCQYANDLSNWHVCNDMYAYQLAVLISPLKMTKLTTSWAEVNYYFILEYNLIVEIKCVRWEF